MRLLYWPNEPAVFDQGRLQVGGRSAFNQLLKTGSISALEIYPYREHLHKLGREFPAHAMGIAGRFQPDLIFVQHVTGNQIPQGFWSALRRSLPNATIAYHDADPYDAFSKRIDAPMKDLLQNCHLSMVCGLGYLEQQFRSLSSAPVFYLPHCFDRQRFLKRDVRLATKSCDVVMIGNRGTRRLAKFLYQPGGRNRARLAKSVSDVFGKSFALYGSGWDRIGSSRGKLKFESQEAALQSARVSINWDHFDGIPYYFSDRLPISLAAGVPHVTSYHVGYEKIFRDCHGLYFCDRWQDVLECRRWLLSKSDDELLNLGLAAQQWAVENLEADSVFQRAFDMTVVVHRRRTDIST